MAESLKKLSILIPVFNEVRTVEEILRRVRAADSRGLEKEIIIVDDASTDGTGDLLKKLPQNADVKVFAHPYNRGKGAALRTALQHATGDVVLIQDADLEYDPGDYPKLLQPILDGRADVVYGSRFAGGTHRVLLFWHYMANRFLTLLSNMLCNLNLTDMETCYKVFRRQCVEGMALSSERFGIEPELTAKLARRRYRFYETDINYAGRDYTEGKKIGWKDGIAALPGRWWGRAAARPQAAQRTRSTASLPRHLVRGPISTAQTTAIAQSDSATLPKSSQHPRLYWLSRTKIAPRRAPVRAEGPWP
jgi:glycosyltransferase involved in cell wall biosynthesis